MELEERKKRIYAEYDYIIRIFRSMGIYDEAKALAGDVMVRAVTKRHQLENPDDPRPWLRSIADRRAAEYFNERKKAAEDDRYVRARFGVEAGEDLDLESKLPDKLTTEQIFFMADRKGLAARLLMTLSEEDKKILLLRSYHKKTFVEIAEMLDKPVSTIKSRYKAIGQKLGEAYYRLSGEEEDHG